MIPGPAESLSALSSALQAQYETLRMAALGEPLPAEARSGLMLFLRRGMWGWARTVTPSNPPAQPVQASAPNMPLPCAYEAVIHLLAQMAISTHERRAP